LQAQRRGVGDAQHHALAGRRVQLVFGRLANDLRAEGVGDDQPGMWRKYLSGHLDGGGE
jgi:hypothetical protein